MSVVGQGLSLLSAPKEATVRLVRGLARDWAGVPRGPLGRVSSRWVMPWMHSAIYRVMGRAAQLRADDELLEVACGSGVFLAQQAGHVARVTGLDLSELQVDLARERLAARVGTGTAEIVQGDAAQLPWPSGSFTVVMCMGSFEVFPDPQQVLAEMVRVLRPGGRVVLNIGERVPQGTTTHRLLGEMWVWSEEDVRAMVEQAGFVDLSIEYVSSAGESRMLKAVNGAAGVFGQDLRIVYATKPVQPT